MCPLRDTAVACRDVSSSCGVSRILNNVESAAVEPHASVICRLNPLPHYSRCDWLSRIPDYYFGYANPSGVTS